MRISDWSSDVCSSDLNEQPDIFRVIERAHAAVAERYPKASPADMTAARRLLVLSLEWSDTLGVGHRNFEEFLAKTRTVIAGTCVGLGQSRIRLQAGSFDWVLFDEAARGRSEERRVGKAGVRTGRIRW